MLQRLVCDRCGHHANDHVNLGTKTSGDADIVDDVAQLLLGLDDEAEEAPQRPPKTKRDDRGGDGDPADGRDPKRREIDDAEPPRGGEG